MNIAFYLHDEIDITSFESKLLWLKRHFNLVSLQTLRELIYDGKEMENVCMLSVDDGWRSTHDIIFPIMKKHNVPFTLFVSPEICQSEKNFWYYTYKFCDEAAIKDIMINRGYFFPEVRKYPADLIMKEIMIDEVYDVINEYMNMHPELEVPRGFMNAPELMELKSSGLVEIGAHTITHPILSSESRERAGEEIISSVEKVSELIGERVRSFAYPNGIENFDYGNDEMDFAEQAGIDMAFSVNPGLISSVTNPLSIPRWGSITRLKFGKLGRFLPSRANQVKIRKEIKKYSRR